MNSIEIHGRGLAPEDIEGAQSYIREEREWYAVEGPIEGELEKSPEDLKAIELIGRYINDELRRLGVPEADISESKFHFFSHEKFAEFFPEEKKDAFHRSLERVICVDVDTFGNKMQFFRALLHESLHSASHEKYYLDKDSDWIQATRSGYRSARPGKEEGEYFLAFNEAVTQKMTDDLTAEHEQEAREQLNIPEADAEEAAGTRLDYDDYIEIIEDIAEHVAEKRGVAVNEVWDSFKRGYFTGDMHHLRDIERVFGKGSLRFMAALPTGMRDMPHEDIARDVKEFFSNSDAQARNSIAQRLLTEEEYARYKKR